MKNKFIFYMLLLGLALLAAACAPQEAPAGPGEATALPTESANGVNTSEGQGAAEGTAVIPETGPQVAGVPDTLDEVITILVAAGASVDLGGKVEIDPVPFPGQSLLINGEEVQIFTYESLEELEVKAAELANDGNPEDEPNYYRMGNMLVRYVGNDPGLRDLLENVLGAQAAGR